MRSFPSKAVPASTDSAGEPFFLALAASATLVWPTGNLFAGSAPVGTQGFADIGTPLAGGSATGDINTATSFTIGNLVSTTSDTGVFSGMSSQVIGAVSFDTTSGTSLSFTNSAFGTFTSTSIDEYTNKAGTVAFYVLGTWTPGTYNNNNTTYTSGPYDASFTISFTQTPPGSGNSISDSATFSVPPTGMPSVPEPASIVMGLTGLVIGGLAYRRHRRQASIA